jgi:hypothetical protein
LRLMPAPSFDRTVTQRGSAADASFSGKRSIGKVSKTDNCLNVIAAAESGARRRMALIPVDRHHRRNVVHQPEGWHHCPGRHSNGRKARIPQTHFAVVRLPTAQPGMVFRSRASANTADMASVSSTTDKVFSIVSTSLDGL